MEYIRCRFLIWVLVAVAVVGCDLNNIFLFIRIVVRLEWAAGFVEIVVVVMADDIEPVVVARSVAVVVIVYHRQVSSPVPAWGL